MATTKVINKKVKNLQLVGLDGNAYSLMGAFQCQARKEGWSQNDIEAVLDECMNGNYNHLVATLLVEHCETPDNVDDDIIDDTDWTYEDYIDMENSRYTEK